MDFFLNDYFKKLQLPLAPMVVEILFLIALGFNPRQLKKDWERTAGPSDYKNSQMIPLPKLRDKKIKA